jgi:hypothetical protein
MDEDLLGREYFHVQKVVEDYDTKVLTVKAWSVSFSAAAIGLAYDKQQAAILAVAIISALSFWMVEALIKVNQQAYYKRIEEIEAHFSDGPQRRPLQIGRAWAGSFKENGRYRMTFQVMAWPHVFMPHAVIALTAAALLIFDAPEKAIANGDLSIAGQHDGHGNTNAIR